MFKWQNRDQTNSIIAMVVSLLLHGLFFFLFNGLLFHPARFSVLGGDSSVEVELIAVPEGNQSESLIELKNEPSFIAEKEKSFQTESLTATFEAVLKESFAETVKTNLFAAEKPITEAGESIKENSSYKKRNRLIKMNLGTSGQEAENHLSGTDDETLIVKSRGSLVTAQPDYLQNPSPIYPEISRRLKEEGTVWLKTSIDIQGRAIQVNVFKSSGFERLDRAAISSVKHWRFKPAQLAGLAVESIVEIPIIFQLK